jgi:hypothetical protein
LRTWREKLIFIAASNPSIMKTLRFLPILVAFIALLYSCAPKYGCPANAVGAENAEARHQHRMNSNLRKF